MKQITKSKNMEQSGIDISDYNKTEQNILKKYIGYTGLHAEIVERNKSKITKSTIHLETGIPKIVRDTVINKYKHTKHTVNLEKVTKNCWEISFCQVNKSINALDNKEKEFLKYTRENHPDYKTFVKIVFEALLTFCQNKTSKQNKPVKQNKTCISYHKRYKKPNTSFTSMKKLREDVSSLEQQLNINLSNDTYYHEYYDEAFKYARRYKGKYKDRSAIKKMLTLASRYEYLIFRNNLNNTLKIKKVKKSTIQSQKSQNTKMNRKSNIPKCNGIGYEHIKAAVENGSIPSGEIDDFYN